MSRENVFEIENGYGSRPGAGENRREDGMMSTAGEYPERRRMY